MSELPRELRDDWVPEPVEPTPEQQLKSVVDELRREGWVVEKREADDRMCVIGHQDFVGQEIPDNEIRAAQSKLDSHQRVFNYIDIMIRRSTQSLNERFRRGGIRG